MSQIYSVNVKLAGINLLFQSDLEIDICHLRTLFKHHLSDEPAKGEACHLIEISGFAERVVPDDASLVWKGYYHAVGNKGDHTNDVKKYVSVDGAFEYFEAKGGDCIVNDLRAGKTLCAMVKKRQFMSSTYLRAGIDGILILLVHVVMARHRRYTLHAAAVEWKGKAIVFTGVSGQGKSTLSTDLTAQGAGFLGDDIVFIYQEMGQLRIGSLLFDAKLFEKSKKDKDFVDVLERYGGKIIDSVPLQAIAEIKQTREGESFVRLEATNDQLFDTLLRSANNIALQYDHDDWLSLCALVLQHHKLTTFYFGDRKLLDKNILDSLYEQ